MVKLKYYKGKHSIKEIITIRLKIQNILKSIDNEITNKFFPRDYPYSVQKGYREFSINHFKSNVIFNTMNFITIQLLINSMGLNINKSNTLMFSAGMNWAIKEGIGQVGNFKLNRYIFKKLH